MFAVGAMTFWSPHIYFCEVDIEQAVWYGAPVSF
jgi:hypothetical protein